MLKGGFVVCDVILGGVMSRVTKGEQEGVNFSLKMCDVIGSVRIS